MNEGPHAARQPPLTRTDSTLGLAQEAVIASRQAQGRNALPTPPRRGFLRIVGQVLREPMFLLLLAAAGLYLLLGDLGESLLLLTFALLSIGLVAVQERRSERAVEALQAMGSPQASVRREGRLQRIAASDVVVGDILLLEEGERVAADGVLVSAEQLAVDESLLTGESVPVDKSALAPEAPLSEPSAEGDTQPWAAYAGTLVVRGHAQMQVLAVGLATRSGEIGRSLLQIDNEPTRLQRGIGRLVRWFALLAVLVSLGLFLGYGWLRQDWWGGALAAIALAMAMLPEEFPMAMAIFFAMGAWRLSRTQVLARHASVIEMLGAATVLCVDKTGTLTENRMALAALQAPAGASEWRQGQPWSSDTALTELLHAAQAASRLDQADPMDRALHEGPEGWSGRSGEPSALLREYPLRTDRLVFAQAWRAPDGAVLLAAKGAPEAVLSLCPGTAAAADVLAQVGQLADQGLRVLGVAQLRLAAGEAAPDDIEGLDWHWLGLVGLQDPLRASVPPAVRRAQQAGLCVLMLTGDFPQTALAIAAQAGLRTDRGALEGAQLADLPTDELSRQVADVDVYARVQPAQKLRLVEALKQRGEVVAMTGDGVNDAPALKAAHIGIAMGRRGTDVAREAADIVLLQDDFSHLVDAIRTGRRIFDNLRKVMLYIAAIHVPIAGLALFPVLLGLPPLLLPAHVVLTEMLIDPMCSVAFENEPEEAGLMTQPPRPVDEPLVGPAQLWLALLLGVVLLAVCLGVYALALGQGMADTAARALAFVALTAGNLALIRSTASRRPAWEGMLSPARRIYWGIAAGVGLILLLALSLPALRPVFAFAWPGFGPLLGAIAAGFAAGLALETVKRWRPVRHWLGA
ncbi:MAG: HAD-IC family P-type ATPase [Lysobacterales bacterium]